MTTSDTMESERDELQGRMKLYTDPDSASILDVISFDRMYVSSDETLVNGTFFVKGFLTIVCAGGASSDDSHGTLRVEIMDRVPDMPISHGDVYTTETSGKFAIDMKGLTFDFPIAPATLLHFPKNQYQLEGYYHISGGDRQMITINLKVIFYH